MGIFDFLKRKKPKEEKIKAEAVKKTKKEAPQAEPVERAPVRKRDVREIYKIIREPHISEKATQLSDGRKYTFKIYSQVNKIQIEKAITNLYGVKVKDVKIINIKSKKRVLRGIEGRKAGHRKAIITLEKGEKIEILPH